MVVIIDGEKWMGVQKRRKSAERRLGRRKEEKRKAKKERKREEGRGEEDRPKIIQRDDGGGAFEGEGNGIFPLVVAGKAAKKVKSQNSKTNTIKIK